MTKENNNRKGQSVEEFLENGPTVMRKRLRDRLISEVPWKDEIKESCGETD